MIYKILGLVLAVLGFAVLKYFPDISSYQHGGMTLSGLLIGALLILAGIGLMIFG
jgi:hypothetical protein